MNRHPVSIVIPNYNRLTTLRACLKAVFELTVHPDWEVIVVDDGSTDGSVEYLECLDRVKVLRQEHRGVAAALNAGFSMAAGRDVVRLHSDVVVDSEDWLECLAAVAYTAPNAGVVGAALVYPDDRVEAIGRNIVTGVGRGIEQHANRCAFTQYSATTDAPPVEVDSAPGGLAYYRRDLIDSIGGIDEAFWPLGLEDDDFCMSARLRGYKVYVAPQVKGVHYKSVKAPTFDVYVVDRDKRIESYFDMDQEVLRLHEEYWEKKWGWNLWRPDLGEIRRIYGGTQVCWKMGDGMRFKAEAWPPTVDACLVTWNNLSLLKRTMESLALTAYPKEQLRVFVTDNGSSDGTKEYLESLSADYPFPLQVDTLPVNVGCPVGLNWAVTRGSGELVARLDDDIVLPADWLLSMAELFRERPYAGVVGPKIINDNSTSDIQCGPYRLYPSLYGHDDEIDCGQADYIARAVHVRGCCNLYRRDALDRCGLFDLRYTPSQADDPDHHIALCVAGYEILYNGHVRVIHKLNDGAARTSAAIANQRGNQSKMYGKWGQEIYRVLDTALDLSREGRYLPMREETGPRFNDAPLPCDFPRRVNNELNKVDRQTARSGADLKAKTGVRHPLDDLVSEHLDLAAIRIRDGYLRGGADVLRTALNLDPARVEILESLADVYAQLGQPQISALFGKRAATLGGGERGRLESSTVPEPVRDNLTPAERYNEIGEANPQIQSTIRSCSSRLRVLMVNTFEHRVAGGDMHQLKKTAEYLRQLGATVDIDCTPCPDPSGYDVVHVWNTWFPHQTLPQVKALRARAPNTPIVLSTIYWNMAEKAWADIVVPRLFGESESDEQLNQCLADLANDKLVLNGLRRSAFNEPNYPEYMAYQRQLIGLVDHLLPLSFAEVRNLKTTLGVKKPYTVVRNGAEHEVFLKADPAWFEAEYGIKDFVLTVGLVEPRKNQLMLLRAVRQLGLPMVVVGRHYDPWYMNLCKRQAPAGTLFIEHLPHELLASAYKAARVFALPSWAECAALVNIEAALSGCALVVSDRTSEPEYYQDNVYYCDPADIHSIRHAVENAYNSYEAAAPCREALKQRFIHNYNWPQSAKATLAAYLQAIERKKAEGGQALSRTISAPTVSKSRGVTLVVRSTDTHRTERCIASLQQTAPAVPILVFADGNLLTPHWEGVEVVCRGAAQGPGKTFNEAAAMRSEDHIVYLEDSACPEPGWFEALTRQLVAGVAAVAPQLRDCNNDECFSGFDVRTESVNGTLGLTFNRPETLSIVDVDATLGDMVLISRQAIDELDFVDEAYADQVGFVDFCLRGRLEGLRVRYVPEVCVRLQEGAETGVTESSLNRLVEVAKEWSDRRTDPSGRPAAPVPLAQPYGKRRAKASVG